MNENTRESFGDYHAEKILMRTMTHTLRPKGGDRALVVAEVLSYLKDNLSSDSSDGIVVKVSDLNKVLKGLSNVSEFSGGCLDVH